MKTTIKKTEKLKVQIVPFQKKPKDPVSKGKTLGCWGPSPDDNMNQC